MKIYTNGYKDNWVSPYTIKEKVFFWKKDYNAFAAKPPVWLSKACNIWLKVANKLNPEIRYIHIDNYDVWSMDTTLARISLPMLKKLKAVKHGAPHVDDSDVPYGLRSFNDTNPEKDDMIDKFFFMRFDWILDELIWTFTAITEGWEDNYFAHNIDEEFFTNGISFFDREGHAEHFARIDNGLRLFGKYYRTLWD